MLKDEKKICFIMCVNDEMYEQECLRFINELEIPEGYTIEQLSIWEAESMTAGYNEAMKYSNAKYKIYLHQDVFIVNRKIISDILNVFQDETVGMLGVVGCLKLPENAIMWNGERVGRLYTSNIDEAGEGNIHTTLAPFQEVETVDGLLIATQYDIPWREDVFTGWDFYDASQSMEFRRSGYKVVVPYMEKPWCIHDDGFLNLEYYYKWRDVFAKEYRRG